MTTPKETESRKLITIGSEVENVFAKELIEKARQILLGIPEFASATAKDFLREKTQGDINGSPTVSFIRNRIKYTVEWYEELEMKRVRIAKVSLTKSDDHDRKDDEWLLLIARMGGPHNIGHLGGEVFYFGDRKNETHIEAVKGFLEDLKKGA